MKRMKLLKPCWGILLATALLPGCARTEILLPTGPQGPEGPAGPEGKSAYELWVAAVSDGSLAYEGATDIQHFFLYLKGKDGDTPVITVGANGNWFVSGEDTGTPARGKDGLSAYELWLAYIQGGNVPDPTGGRGDADKDGLWDRDKDSPSWFWVFLTGKDGQDGLTPHIGENGNWHIGGTDTGIPAQGKDGRSAYEIWKELVETAVIRDWASQDTAIQDFIEYLKGEKGDPGDTPVITIGDNGNWFVDGTDTQVAARGKDGVSAYELWVKEIHSEQGVEDPKNPGNKWDPAKDGISDFFDFLKGARGEDGRSAYEIWKAFIATGNADDPRNQGGKWPAGKNTEADFFLYLSGKDGINGLSAYELWKNEVLSSQGLDNPGNGLYDPQEYPTWPKQAVSLNDFYRYLRGADGTDGQDGKDGESIVEIINQDNYLPGKYNLLPIPALTVRTADGKTTTEYVNPFSGGVAYQLLGPGPVIIPDGTVTVKDVCGNTYTWTSDQDGIVYVPRNGLPVWKNGLPSANAPVAPLRIRYGGRTFDAPETMAENCIIPYQVGLSARIVKAEFGKLTGNIYSPAHSSAASVVLSWQASRIVEGQSQPWPSDRTVSYSYFRTEEDLKAERAIHASFDGTISMIETYAASGNGKGVQKWTADHYPEERDPEKDDFLENTYGNEVLRTAADTEEDGVSGKKYSFLVIGDASQSVIPVHDIVSSGKSKGGTNAPYMKYVASYGTVARTWDTDRTLVEIPEIYPMGGLDNEIEDPEVDPGTGLPRKASRYEIILGQTQLYGIFDAETFGVVYADDTHSADAAAYRDRYDLNAGLQTGTILCFKRYPSLEDYLSDGGDIGLRLSNEGMLNGVRIHNEVTITRNHFNLDRKTCAPFQIKNVYDGFSVTFDNCRSGSPGRGYVLYTDAQGTFRTTGKSGEASVIQTAHRDYTFTTSVKNQ